MAADAPPLIRKDSVASTFDIRVVSIGIAGTFVLLNETTSSGLNVPTQRWVIAHFGLRITTGALRVQRFSTLGGGIDILLDQAGAAAAYATTDWLWFPPSGIYAMWRPDFVDGIGGEGIRLIGGGAGGTGLVTVIAHRILG